MYGANIKKFRQLRGKTQEDIAAYLGVAPQTIYKYEKEINEPDTKTLAKLADYFEITVDELLGRTVNEPIEIAANMGDKADLSEMSEKDKQFILDMIERLKGNKD